MHGNTWIWNPDPELIKRTNVYRFMDRLGFHNLDKFLQFSHKEIEPFWDQMVKEVGIEWFSPYESVLDLSKGIEWSRWFSGGRLNIAWNCLDRHATGPAAKRIACIGVTEKGEYRTATFAELYSQVNRLANAMRGLGLSKGDRVAVYMPMIPEVVAVLYACFKLGLVVVPIFSGFGPSACATRIQDSGARILFTTDAVERRGHVLRLKSTADESLENNTSVEKVIIYRHLGLNTALNARRDIWWDDFLENQPITSETLPLESEELALLIYTSGTSGKPKGTIHTHAGFLSKVAAEIYLAFDHQPDDRFFWLTDIGWMMGPWSIVGNHHFGGTVLLYSGAPDFPTVDRLWQLIEEHRITTFGISPTAVRMVMSKGKQPSTTHELRSLRLLGSTGEPWDEASYMWFFEKVGRSHCPVINISGGTEVAGSFLCALPIQPLKPCSLGGPAPGMAAEVFDENGHIVRGQKGLLVCTRPAPCMTRGLWNDPEGYLGTYWSRWKGIWNHGDWASVDGDGQWFVHGRADEAFNVAGRKIGPAEIEQALMEHGAINEAAVIGVPDKLTGESIVAFVVLKKDVAAPPDLAEDLRAYVAQLLGPTLRPRSVYIVPELPKTPSGKIVRRAIRQVYVSEEIADTSTLENPAALSHFRAFVQS